MSSFRERNRAAELLGFTYPKLHTGKKWFIDFFALDPLTGTMRRKKYHIDNIEKIGERRKYPDFDTFWNRFFQRADY